MGRPRFSFPGNVQETIDLLNKSDLELWNLSVAQEAETLYVYDGDQVVFVADTEPEVLDFLSGAFLATFNGKGLDQIKSELARRNRQPAE